MNQKQPLEVIRELIPNLPERDRRLALSYMEKRDFESILELVISDIYLVEENSVKENPSPKYENVDYNKLLELKTELEEYITLLGITKDWFDESLDYE